MFGLIARKNSSEKPAAALYAAIAAQAREPFFYSRLGVPDTVEGRFDLLLLHLFLVINRLVEERGDDGRLAQALFDVTFRGMDKALREQGIGDMGVPKRMKKMMTAFNGRLHAYRDAASAPDDAALRRALLRNLYGTMETVEPEVLDAFCRYVRENIAMLEERGYDDLQAGRIGFFPGAERRRG